MATYQPKVFSFAGRIGRLRYLAYSLAWGLVATVLSGVVGAIMGLTGSLAAMMLGFIISVAIGLVPMFTLAVRRLNDLNVRGWWSLLLLVPLVNLAVVIYTLFWPGSSGSNRFGPAPVANTTPVVIAALIVPVLAIIAIVLVVVTGMSMESALNAGEFDFEYYAE